jgi:N-acetylmuramic acid 6-phosphate etherase
MMVNMQLTNKKLVERGIRMIVDELDIQREAAAILLQQHGSVKKAIDYYNKTKDKSKK